MGCLNLYTRRYREESGARSDTLIIRSKRERDRGARGRGREREREKWDITIIRNEEEETRHPASRRAA